MKHPRGKFLSLFMGTLSLAVLSTAGIASKDRIQERYFGYKLAHGREPEQLLAAMRLRRLSSSRVVPYLSMALKESVLKHAKNAKVPSRWAAELEQTLEGALIEMGEKALPTLIQGIADQDPGFARRCYGLVRRICLEAFPETRTKLAQRVTITFEGEESIGQAIQRLNDLLEVQVELREIDSGGPFCTASFENVPLYVIVAMILANLDLEWVLKKDRIVIGNKPNVLLKVLEEEDDKWSKDIRRAAAETYGTIRGNAWDVEDSDGQWVHARIDQDLLTK